MRSRSIRHTISAVAGTCLLVAVAATVGFGVYSAGDTQALVSERVSNQVQENTLVSLKGVAGTQAGIIQAKFDLALDAARTMADASRARGGERCAHRSTVRSPQGAE